MGRNAQIKRKRRRMNALAKVKASWEARGGDKTPAFVSATGDDHRIQELASLLKQMVVDSVPELVDDRHAEMHALAIRIAVQSQTMWSVIHNTSITIPRGLEGEQEFSDYASALVLIRSLIDNFASLFYVYLDPLSIGAEYDFRHAVWEYIGLKQQLRRMEQFRPQLASLKKPTREQKAALKSQDDELNFGIQTADSLFTRISKMPEYASLNKDARNRLKRGDPFGDVTWYPALVRSGISMSHASFAYARASEYVHGYSLSARALARLNKPEVDYELDQHLDVVKYLLCACTDAYAKRFKAAAATLSKQPELQTLIGDTFAKELERKNAYVEVL